MNAEVGAYCSYQTARGFSARTVHRRLAALDGFGAFIRPTELRDATASDVEEWLLTKASATTRHAYRSDLNRFYAWAVRRCGYETNPISDTDPIKVPKSLPRPIGPEVAAVLIVGRRRTRQMAGLGLFAGLRCAEIAAICSEDIWTHQAPAVLVVRNGKGGKDRVVPMHPELVALLADRPRTGPLFRNSSGHTIRAASVSALLSRHLRRCGIEATPHQLRHTFGTEFARHAGGNLVATAAAMGHGSTQTTMGYVGWSGESAGIVARMFSPTETSTV